MAPREPTFAFRHVNFLGRVVYTVLLRERCEPLDIRRAAVGLTAGISLLAVSLAAGTGAPDSAGRPA